jgi:hypothetical protein
MSNSDHRRRWLAAVALLALSALAAFVLSPSGGSTAGASASGLIAPPSAISPGLRAAFPVFATAPATDLPASIRRVINDPAVQGQFAPNAALARLAHAPDAERTPFYVVPGADSLCLMSEEGATCQPLDAARQGRLMLQFITPYSDDMTSPLPPPGTPAKSVVVGLAPSGVTDVAASSGSSAKFGDSGLYRIAGTGLDRIAMERPAATPLAVALPR